MLRPQFQTQEEARVSSLELQLRNLSENLDGLRTELNSVQEGCGASRNDCRRLRRSKVVVMMDFDKILQIGSPVNCIASSPLRR